MLNQFVLDWIEHGYLAREEFHEIRRETFRNYRIPRPGICMTHMDTEPCAECWIPKEAP